MITRKIYWKTFFKQGIKENKDNYGNALVCGFQGSGKTYFAVFWTLQQIKENKNYKVKTNIKSLKINEEMGENREVEYFTNLDEIIYDTQQYTIYVIDEVSRAYDKTSKTDKQFYAFLQQSRKMHRIVLLITQELKEVPMWLRRPLRFIYTTNKIPFTSLFKTSLSDAQNGILNKDTLEWEYPIIATYTYKRTKDIAKKYDTFEAIASL